ncbi:MAG: ABC transporter ATP-binding protein [Opitutae bacterium]|nr:ABC transporter ATP-binding protein [Opitutae bacterium]
MHGERLISAQNLSKAYRIWSDPAQRLFGPLLAEAARWVPGSAGESLRQKAHAAYRDFYALRDVSFELRRGEAVGIVGRNGAGKSTLLQLIAGTLQPTAGEIQVRGRVAALLELGAGFNPEFTGRENVFLSGAVLGLSKAEMEARFDAVAAFADIGEFIEQPVKTYSSGMMMRLAFAVNTCVDPEILIVDEALSVGDAPFQAKCFRRLRQLIDNGVSLLFVSHDLGTVRSICSRALWLKNGRAEMWGDAKTVAKQYEKFCWAEQGVAATAGATSAAPRSPLPANSPVAAVPASARWQTTIDALAARNLLLPVVDQSTRLGSGAITIAGLTATNAAGTTTAEFAFNEEVTLHYRLEARDAIDSEFIIGIRLKDVRGNFVCSVQDIDCIQRLRAAAGETVYARTTFRVPLTHGDYILRTGIFGFVDGLAFNGPTYDFGRAVLWDVREDAMHLQVRVNNRMPLAGPVHFPAELRVYTSAGEQARASPPPLPAS